MLSDAPLRLQADAISIPRQDFATWLEQNCEDNSIGVVLHKPDSREELQHKLDASEGEVILAC